MTAAVQLSDVSRHFGGRSVLDRVDINIDGGITAVLGANGSGKTTLLRCIATLLAPDSGTVRIGGLDPANENERIEIRRRLGHLPQHVGFSARSTVYDAVDYFAVLKELHDDRRRRVEVFDALERVGLGDRLRDAVTTLSGGMQRRVALAQALLGRPTLIVLDEPSAGFDPDERMRLWDIAAERRGSATIILSTHQANEAALADRVVVLHGGGIRFSGTPASLARRATGMVWTQPGLPPPNVRGSWRQPDGRHRCVGTPPPGAVLDEPSVEDGYLIVTS